MKCQAAHLAVLFSVILCGCTGEGGGVPVHPKITANQIEKDVEAAFPRSGPDGAYEGGKLEILESHYSGDKASIVVNAGSINVGKLVPADIEGLKPEIQPKTLSIDKIFFKLKLDYEWIRNEWRLRRLDNLTLGKK